VSGDSYEVPPLSREKIRAVVRGVRRIACQLAGRPDDQPYFDLVRFLDVVLPAYAGDDYAVEILDIHDMQHHHGEAHALAIPAEQTILVREDIWQRAECGHGRDRLTLAHELGHLVLHSKPTFARRIGDTQIPAYRDSEWQANAFAGELLVSAGFVRRCRSPQEAARIFGVSEHAAQTQWSAFRKDGLV